MRLLKLTRGFTSAISAILTILRYIAEASVMFSAIGGNVIIVLASRKSRDLLLLAINVMLC